MPNKSQNVHENYHKKTTAQSKIIENNNFTYRHLIGAIEDYLKPGMTILDIGCGAGTLDFYLANKGYNITGVDISKSAIKSCITTAKNLGLKNTSFKVIDFPSEKLNKKFDFIILTEVIEHLENDKLAINRIYSMLNQNGLLFLSTPLKSAPLNKLGLTKKFDKEVGHLRRYDKQELINMLRDEKFEIINIKMNEGIVRNTLFVNPYAGKSVRYIKFFLSDLVTALDKLSQSFFGYSNIFIICKK